MEDIVIDKKKGKNQPASQTTKKSDSQVQNINMCYLIVTRSVKLCFNTVSNVCWA